MATKDFVDSLEELIRNAEHKKACIMCAEAVPWRCHRSLVADALVIRGITVINIISATNYEKHELTKFAIVSGVGITYPSE